MRVVACMIVNTGAAKFLPFSLSAVYGWADEILIIGGCDRRWVDIGAGKDTGFSMDGVEIIVNVFPDPQKKIRFVTPKVYPHRNAQRDEYLKRVENGDLVFIVDADEFYHNDDIKTIKGVFYNNKDALFVKYGFYQFYSFTRRWPKIPIMERVFRKQDGMHYPDKDTGQSIVMGDGTAMWGIKDQRCVVFGSVFCYHYANVRDDDVMMDKILFHRQRDNKMKNIGKLSDKEVGMMWREVGETGIKVRFDEHPKYAQAMIKSGIFPCHSVNALWDC